MQRAEWRKSIFGEAVLNIGFGITALVQTEGHDRDLCPAVVQYKATVMGFEVDRLFPDMDLAKQYAEMQLRKVLDTAIARLPEEAIFMPDGVATGEGASQKA